MSTQPAAVGFPSSGRRLADRLGDRLLAGLTLLAALAAIALIVLFIVKIVDGSSA